MSSLNKNTVETDWKFVAQECQRKLNLIAGELASWTEESSLADCCFMADYIVKKFHLDSGSVGVLKPEYVELRKKLDAITGLVVRLRFAPIHSRDAMTEELNRLLGDFSLNFSIFGAFICL